MQDKKYTRQLFGVHQDLLTAPICNQFAWVSRTIWIILDAIAKAKN